MLKGLMYMRPFFMHTVTVYGLNMKIIKKNGHLDKAAINY